MKKGQVSFEYFLVVSFAFALLIPVMILFLVEMNDLNNDVSAVQITKLADELANTVNDVYYLGAPTKKTFKIYIPNNIESLTFNDKVIQFNVTAGKTSYTITRYAAANMTGSINLNQGTHYIEVTATKQGVNITG